MKKDNNRLFSQHRDVVIIYTRDINGKKWHHIMWDDEVEIYIDRKGLNDEELEILMVKVNDVCVYSSLASPRITWEDVIGFFA